MPIHPKTPKYIPTGKFSPTAGLKIIPGKVTNIGIHVGSKLKLKKGKLYDHELTYMSKFWHSRECRGDLMTEVCLYMDESCLQPLQGTIVPYLVAVTDLPGGRVQASFEVPHCTGWREADAFLSEQEKAAVLDVYRLLHKQGVLHGSVGFENILITDAGRVQLINFGQGSVVIPHQHRWIGVCKPADLDMELGEVTALLNSTDNPNLGRRVVIPSNYRSRPFPNNLKRMHVTENGRTLIKRFAPIHIDNADGIVNNSTDPEGAAYEPARSNPSQLPARLGSPLSGVQGEETAPASGSSPRGAQKDEDLAAKCNFAHLPMPPSPAPARAAIVALPVDSAWAPAVTPPDAIPGGLPDLNVNLTLANDARAHANEDPELPAITGDTRDDIAGPSVEAEANLALSEKLQENISIVAIDAGSNPENHADIEEESISTARPQLPAYKRFSIDRLFHSVLIATGWREGPSEEAERAGASVSRAAPPDEVVHLGKRDREDENDQDDNRRPGTRTRSMGPSPSPSRILEALSHHD